MRRRARPASPRRDPGDDADADAPEVRLAGDAGARHLLRRRSHALPGLQIGDGEARLLSRSLRYISTQPDSMIGIACSLPPHGHRIEPGRDDDVLAPFGRPFRGDERTEIRGGIGPAAPGPCSPMFTQPMSGALPRVVAEHEFLAERRPHLRLDLDLHVGIGALVALDHRLERLLAPARASRDRGRSTS